LLLVATAAALGVLALALPGRLPRPTEAFGQERFTPSTGRGTEEQAVRRASVAHVEAMQKGDLEAILAFWTPDADYFDETGKATRGKEALRELLKKGLMENKGNTITGKVNSLKFLRPEVAMEDGTLEFAAPDGSKESNRYTVVWVKS